MTTWWNKIISRTAFLASSVLLLSAQAALNEKHYYAHDAVLDQYGVIAPWYHGLNGQCDYRVRIAAETLKRYPWTTTNNAIAAYPDYLFTSKWLISSNGTITTQDPGDWMDGDLGQRYVSVLNGMVDYYRYSGDPVAIAHITFMADLVLDHELTPADHPWPKFPISVPVKGKAYYEANTNGMIQLDICADMGRALLRAYELTGNARWLDAAKHWGDQFALHCNLDPKKDPWPRYANPENCPWQGVNKQTGGVTMVLAFLDELIRLGYTGSHQEIVTARDAGQRYLGKTLLPKWTGNETWGDYFWDWPNPVQNCSTTADVAMYLINNKKRFPNWRNDARNILTQFLMRSSANPDSSGDVYSGAWAYPESSSCCGRSLWYAPLLDGGVMAQLGAESNDPWMRELAYRQFILQTCDVHENGVSEDNIDGGVIVNGNWLNIAHPLPLRWVLWAMGWLPEELGANRENHLVRSGAVVNSIVYGKGEITYSTFDAPVETVDVLRLSFVPQKITANGKTMSERHDLEKTGFTVKKLSNGDAIVQIRHDGATKIVITGNDPQTILTPAANGGTYTATFSGNQLRVVGDVNPSGGLAEVFLDGEKQLAPVDFWNPSARTRQIVYYQNGLKNAQHTLKIVALGSHHPYSLGNQTPVESVQFSAEDKVDNFPTGTGPTGPQRLIFGYPERKDYHDTKGFLWRPGLEVVAHLGHVGDTMTATWQTNAGETIIGTRDPELYRYGIHGHDFRVNLTAGPGRYDLRLAFANTHGWDTGQNCFAILINGKTVVEKFDVTATARGTNKATDLVFKNIAPMNGMVEVRFKGYEVNDGQTVKAGEAFVQALELAPRLLARGSAPISSTLTPSANLLVNPGFEETTGMTKSRPKREETHNAWTYVFAGKTNGYAGQENKRGTDVHSGKGALRICTDGNGHLTSYQDVEVKPSTSYTASVWIRAVDGFGKSPGDSAGFTLQEMNYFNKPLSKHPKIETKQAGPYTLLSQKITTGPQASKVRFSLDTVLQCPAAEGYVTYDDCSFQETGASKK